jgi:DNA-binding transcriptional MerR regulator
MTPQEYEWRIEQTENGYLRGDFGKITFHRRMSSLGFSTAGIKEQLAELDERKAKP